MALQVEIIDYGKPALERLRALIAEFKTQGALTPVTVVVPRAVAGLATARELAAVDKGICAVRFQKLSDIAIRLADASVSGKSLKQLSSPVTGDASVARQSHRQLSSPVIGAAIRTVLKQHQGLLRHTANHPATEQALIRAYQDLRDLTSDNHQALTAQSQRAKDVIDICKQVVDKLKNKWYDDQDLHRIATKSLQNSSSASDELKNVLTELGPIIVYLPQHLPRSQGKLIAALSQHTEVVIMAGLTGNPDADRVVCEAVERSGGSLPTYNRGKATELAHAQKIISTASTDEEINVAIDETLTAIRAGTPLHRIAILCGEGRSTIRHLQSALEAAGICYNGVAGHTLANSLAGRCLSALLELEARDFRRGDVLALIATLPNKLPDNTNVLAAAWERISRNAGVTRGANKWDSQLSHYAAQLRADADTLKANQEDADWSLRRAAKLEQEAKHADSLKDFVHTLRIQLEQQNGTNWNTWCQWLNNLLSYYLGGTDNRDSWPEHETKAAKEIELAINRLKVLTKLEPSPRTSTFQATFLSELNKPMSRIGKFGQGVITGSVGETTGVPLDRLIIIGMAEGTFPHSPSEDPLLPERERIAAGGELPTLNQQIHDMHRQLLIAMSFAKHTTLIYARANHNGSREQQPSRWWLDTAKSLDETTLGSNKTVSFTNLADAGLYHHVASFAERTATSEFPANLQGYQLQELEARGAQAQCLQTSETLKQSHTMITERASNAFTQFDGNLADYIDVDPLQQEFSPTSLETWAACPMQYFLGRILGVQGFDQPEELLEISPLDKGSLIHEILEQFMQEQISQRAVPAPSQPWNAAQHNRLQQIAEAHFVAAEAKGLTGTQVFWLHTRTQIRADLERFLAEDNQWRATHGATPIASELQFGKKSERVGEVSFKLSDGRKVYLRGQADRIDETKNNTYIVTDYKTGKSDSFKKLNPPKKLDDWDPVVRGTKLQLPAYMLAAQQLSNETQPQGRAEYRFVTAQGDYKTIGYKINEIIVNRFREVIEKITAGITTGIFCDRPEPGASDGQYSQHCQYCNADRLGTTEQRKTWERKCDQPLLATYRQLAEPEDPSPKLQELTDPQNQSAAGIQQLSNPSSRTSTNVAADHNDQADRNAVLQNLQSTLFVEAGAGSGKTTALVGRICALLEDGVPMENIAAITFTEKAAYEMKNRLRVELANSGKHPEALDQLDGAAITTLHGFALRILSLHALEAGLPPKITVSPVDSFEDRWEEIRQTLFNDPEWEKVISLGLIIGVTLRHLKELVSALDNDWDLAEDRIGRAHTLTDEIGLPPLSRLTTQIKKVTDLSLFCKATDDKLFQRLNEIAKFGEQLKTASNQNAAEQSADKIALKVLFGSLPSFKVSKTGKKDNWPQDTSPDIADVREQIIELGEHIEDTKNQVADAVIRKLTAGLSALVLKAADERTQHGVLEFHDLLVLARQLLRHPEHGPLTRKALSLRYQRLLLDEFQDTDPLQIDLVKLIASPVHETGTWESLHDKAGRLFYVGDPKQSIYRFRRADIALYAQAAVSPTVANKSLTRNFRSTEPLIEWINNLFKQLMGSTQDTTQPAYTPLQATRPKPPDGPCLAVIGNAYQQKTSTAHLRELEAADVAKTVLTAISQGWSVGNGKNAQGQEKWRKARLSDICILLPTRTSLPQLEAALQAENIPYRMEAGSLLWASQPIRETMSTVRALADPTNEIALIGALRSPAFGCGDHDLYTYRVKHKGRWNYLEAPPKSLDQNHLVIKAMSWLRAQNQRVRWESPSQIIQKIITERHLLELGCFSSHRARDVWQNLHWLISQARLYENDGGTELRGFLAWVDRQISEQVRNTDALLSETDDDAVRITTIHAAKGREFPIVILTGTYSKKNQRNNPTLLWTADGQWGVGFKQGLRTRQYTENIQYEQNMDAAEQVRLLYVALTRARDHLVVSVFRKPSRNTDSENLTDCSLAEMVANTEPVPTLLPLTNTDYSTAEQPKNAPDLSLQAWQDAKNAALKRAAKSHIMSASKLPTPDNPNADHPSWLNKDQSDEDQDPNEPIRKGRGGTNLGKAVHGVLQDLDLKHPTLNLDALCDAQARAEGIANRKSEVKNLINSTLKAKCVQQAAQSDHWKEIYVGAPIIKLDTLSDAANDASSNSIVLNGYIDLLYRTNEGLVVVDYKTDDTHNNENWENKIKHYKQQVAAYALVVEKATDEQVASCVLVFARAGQTPQEILLASEELSATKQEVRSILADSVAR